jgi:CubicO group peptidase (beta-lactamase class C family)
MVVRELAAKHAPGAALAIVRNGRIWKVRGYGYADLESCAPMTPETRLGIGSISKQITAAVALTLVRDGLISLDDPIVKYLPEGSGAWDAIRIRDLLTHTSGIPDYTDDDSKYPSIKLDRTSNPPTTELLKQIAAAKRNFPPGDDWAYSNTGYLVLSALLERAGKLPFPELVRRRVLEPLGMTRTRFYSPLEIIPGRGTPYKNDDKGTFSHGPYISDTFSRGGDTGMISTASDMARWALALGKDRILAPALWREMLQPVRLTDGTPYPYCFGMFLGQVGNDPLWLHSGSFRVGYTAMLTDFPDRRLATVSLVNVSGYSSPAEAISFEAAGMVAPDLVPSSMKQTRRDPDPQLAASLLNLLKGASAGAAPMTAAFQRHDEFHKLYARALSETRLTPELRYVECTGVRSQPAAAMGVKVARQCTYQLAGVTGVPDGLIFWLTPGGQVAGLDPW